MPPHDQALDRLPVLTGSEAGVAAGLDAIDGPTPGPRRPLRARARAFAGAVLPPIVTLVALVCLWQALWAAAIWPEYQLPAPAAVWQIVFERVQSGQAVGIVWVSLHRAVIGFLLAVAVAIPLGLMISGFSLVRKAIGPLVSGLQSLPSVAWVPPAVLWFGLTDVTVYVVVLLGAVPAIANGLVAGIDQIPPILPRVGRVLSERPLDRVRHVLLPAALPGFLTGLKLGWAFAWRSLMAAELIAVSPQLGLGGFLDNGRSLSDMPTVIAAILLILLMGIGVELAVFRPLERSVLRARGLRGAL